MGNSSEIVIYHTDSGDVEVDVRLQDKMIWLTQRQIGDLFEASVNTISEHIVNIYADGELDADSTIRKFRVVTEDGKTRQINHYNLDMVISVGFRVNSVMAVKFRKWANKIISDYLVQGFAINPAKIAYDTRYFHNLLQKIREIRASEQDIYAQVRDLVAETSVDYKDDPEVARKFFAVLQNKFHVAITGQTGQELILNRVDAAKRNMGMMSWRGENITQKQAMVAKNYLGKTELEQYEMLVSLFFDFAIFQTSVNNKTLKLNDWLEKFDAFMKLSDRPIFKGQNVASHEKIQERVKSELEEYRNRLPYGGDLPDQG